MQKPMLTFERVQARALFIVPHMKRAHEEEAVTSSKRMRGHEVFSPEEVTVLALVPDIYGILAAALDPISQRAFCCASRGCAEAMGPLCSPFPMLMLRWVAAPEDDNVPFAYVLDKQRRWIAKQRIRMGLHYDHAAFILVHMPFLKVVEYGVEDRPRKWLKQLMAFDAAECLVGLMPSLTGAIPDGELRETIETTFRALTLGPKLVEFAIMQQWITLKSIFWHGRSIEYTDQHQRTDFRAATVADVYAAAASLDTDLMPEIEGTAACRAMLVRAFRPLARGGHTALKAILDAMAKVNTLGVMCDFGQNVHYVL
jgi:hypothetical protein